MEQFRRLRGGKGLSRRAVLNRYKELLGDAKLSPAKDTLLRLVSRLIIHSEDLSHQLYRDDNHTDNIPEETLTQVLDLSNRIEHLLGRIFDDPEKSLSVIDRMKADGK